MKKKRIAIKDFTKIFTSRTFTWQDKLGKNIYLVEREGDYFIEEYTSYTAIALSTVLLPVGIVSILIMKGIIGLIECLGDLKYLYGNKPLRQDGLYHNTSSTDTLLQLAGWT